MLVRIKVISRRSNQCKVAGNQFPQSARSSLYKDNEFVRLDFGSFSLRELGIIYGTDPSDRDFRSFSGDTVLFCWRDSLVISGEVFSLVLVGSVVGGSRKRETLEQLSLEGVGSGGCNLILWSNSSFNLRSIINIVLQGPKRLQPLCRRPTTNQPYSSPNIENILIFSKILGRPLES